MIRRRAAKDQSAKEAAMRPLGTRAAGAGGSNATMLRLYTDDAPGLKVYVSPTTSSSSSSSSACLFFSQGLDTRRLVLVSWRWGDG